ncbi:MAG TPA: DNA polymerase/3'-5' exonuclease PolX [Gemmatimonadaceae bacterium]|nr:DNA polymerase/3'-5' exonuclease PolX [Gemmatimonadaceae bacterium]
MDTRSTAHTLHLIAELLELQGENRFKASAYRTAARAVAALDLDDLGPLLRSGELERTAGVGPATIAVIRDLETTGESRLFEQLRESTPEGLLEMMRVPGLGTAKIQAIHERLGVETLHELEEAARNGRLARLPRFGPKTAEKILKGIAFLRETGALVLYPHALAEGRRLLGAVRAHPDVAAAELAGSLRRHREIVRDLDIVAACRAAPEQVAASFAHSPGVRAVVGGGGRSLQIRYVDGTLLDLHCVTPDEFAVALWRATGNDDHVRLTGEQLAARGLTISGDRLLDRVGARVPVADEPALYALAGLAWVPPELREGRGEIAAAGKDALPMLVEPGHIRGVLHCHSQYSDGASTITEMVAAAKRHGWSYLGVSDHSQSAFYAGGLTREGIDAQHEEIERLNAEMGDFRLLKGIEADILPCGRVDYDGVTLDRFDYVIASIHSRFGMDETQMTDRVLKALDDPHLTVLGHPTGRLLLTREPYAIDMEAVLDKAAEHGVAVELNADPHRLDLDWRMLRRAKEKGVMVEIGPDAHSTQGLENMDIGVGIARKGWIEPGDVLNALPVEDVLAHARRRRVGVGGTG